MSANHTWYVTEPPLGSASVGSSSVVVVEASTSSVVPVVFSRDGIGPADAASSFEPQFPATAAFGAAASTMAGKQQSLHRCLLREGTLSSRVLVARNAALTVV